MRAGRYVAVVLILLNVLIGLAPVGFVLASSTLAGRIPAAVTGGVGSPAWRTLVGAFLLAGAANLLQQVLTPLRPRLLARSGGAPGVRAQSQA
jgi:ATP-binding cassette subfamily B protein